MSPVDWKSITPPAWLSMIGPSHRYRGPVPVVAGKTIVPELNRTRRCRYLLPPPSTFRSPPAWTQVIPLSLMVPPVQLSVPKMYTMPGPLMVPEPKFTTALGPTVRLFPVTVTVWPLTTSVWVPVDPPKVRSANAGATSSVTVYVPPWVISTVSSAAGGAPVLHRVPSLQLPLTAASQDTRAGGATMSNGALVIGGNETAVA